MVLRLRPPAGNLLPVQHRPSYDLLSVLVSFGDDESTRAVIRAVQREGTCWCGGSFWQGKAAMRISVSSWATAEEDVEKSLAAIIRVASGVR